MRLNKKQVLAMIQAIRHHDENDFDGLKKICSEF